MTSKKQPYTREELERVQSLLNREPRPLEISIYTRLWHEECSGKYSRPLLSELPSDSSRAVKEHPKMLELGDNYQMLFQVTPDMYESERSFAGLGARSIATAVFTHGGDDKHAEGALQPLALSAYAAGIPILKVWKSGISRKNLTLNVAALALLRNKKFPSTILQTSGAEIWWIHTRRSASDEEERIRAIRLNEMMVALSLHPWLLAANPVQRAGLLCTLVNMMGEGRLGIQLDTEFWDEEPEEMLLGRNPGGFIICFRRTFEREVREILSDYDAESIFLGRSTDDGKLIVVDNRVDVAVIPFDHLLHYSGEPVYHNESERVLEVKNRRTRKDEHIPEPEDYGVVLKTLLTSPRIHFCHSSPANVDSTIRGNTVCSTSEQPFLRLKGSRKMLTLSMTIQDYHHERDAHVAAYNAVVRASRQIASQGAEVLGVSVSFMEGNPEKSNEYFRFLDAVRGVAGAAKALKIPVLGEHIEWYNLFVKDSPVVAAAGVLESGSQCIKPGFQNDGDFICILGSFRGELESSEYVRFVHGIEDGRLVPADGDFTYHLNMALMQAAREKILKSALDMEIGGLSVALVKSALLNPVKIMGCDIYTMRKMRDDALLFGESTSTVLITLEEHKLMDMERIANDFGVACTTVGRVRDHGKISFNDLFELDLKELQKLINQS